MKRGTWSVSAAYKEGGLLLNRLRSWKHDWQRESTKDYEFHYLFIINCRHLSTCFLWLVLVGLGWCYKMSRKGKQSHFFLKHPLKATHQIFSNHNPMKLFINIFLSACCLSWSYLIDISYYWYVLPDYPANRHRSKENRNRTEDGFYVLSRAPICVDLLLLPGLGFYLFVVKKDILLLLITFFSAGLLHKIL